MQLFGVADFDRVFPHYSLSMIPVWTAALDNAALHLAPDEQLYIVDFGNQPAQPTWFQGALRAWLAKLHITPRIDLGRALVVTTAKVSGNADSAPLLRSYAQRDVQRRSMG